MTHDELITVARTHTVDFPKLSGESWANQEMLNKVAALDTVVVSFESDEHPKKIMGLLEKGSGKFLSRSASLRAALKVSLVHDLTLPCPHQRTLGRVPLVQVGSELSPNRWGAVRGGEPRASASRHALFL